MKLEEFEATLEVMIKMATDYPSNSLPEVYVRNEANELLKIWDKEGRWQ